MEVFERATESLPKKAYAIQPHPEGIELGELRIKLLRYTADKKKLRYFLRRPSPPSERNDLRPGACAKKRI